MRLVLHFTLEVEDPAHVEQSRAMLARLGLKLGHVQDAESGGYLTSGQVAAMAGDTPAEPVDEGEGLPWL